MSFRHIYRNPLGLISKNSSRNPTPGRKREKDLIPAPPAYPKPKSFELHKEAKDLTFMINLEDLLVIERNLLFIINTFHSTSEVSKACEDVWELTADNTLNQMSELYRDDAKKTIIRRYMVLQSVGMAVAHYFVSQFKLSYEMSSSIKSLVFFIHKGFIIITKLILLRVPYDKENLWIQKLNELIAEFKTKKKSPDAMSHLNHYNKAIASYMKKVLRSYVFRCEEETIKALKNAILQVLRRSDVAILEARGMIEKAFGIKRESVQVSSFGLKAPFLPPIQGKVFTLVLDLDETLVHYIENEEKGQYLSRPYVENFLKEMHEHYEIVVFTAAIQEYADWILDDLDCTKLITHRLYRQHTIPAGNYFLKDLSQLGRDLSKMIIVDNVSENFQLQPSNGILIKSWYDDATDNALQELQPLLTEIVTSDVSDVRLALSSYRQQLLDQLSKGIENPKLSLSKPSL